METYPGPIIYLFTYLFFPFFVCLENQKSKFPPFNELLPFENGHSKFGPFYLLFVSFKIKLIYKGRISSRNNRNLLIFYVFLFFVIYFFLFRTSNKTQLMLLFGFMLLLEMSTHKDTYLYKYGGLFPFFS